MIKMILAVDRDGAIGWSDGRLPWKLKHDMARFKALTTGHTVVMGFNTFVSLARPDGLPDRKNIVLTRKSLSQRMGYPIGDNIDLISSLDWVQRQDQAMQSRAASEWSDVQPTIWIIGGKSVYEEALSRNMVDEIHLTMVDATSGADVVMSTNLIDWKLFVLQQRERGVMWNPIRLDYDAAVANQPGTSYLVLRK